MSGLVDVVVVVVGGGDAYLLSAGAGCSHMSGIAKRAVKSEGWGLLERRASWVRK